MKKTIILIFIALLACKSSQEFANKLPIISMTKTPCFGSCPSFDIHVYTNGDVQLIAKEFLPISGKFKSKLSKIELNRLITIFEESNFSNFQKRYTSNKSDLPTTFLTYRTSSTNVAITVEDYDQAPQNLKGLETMIQNLIERLDWKQIK
jgi:hypothetical protein